MSIPIVIYEVSYQGNIISYKSEVESVDDIKKLKPIYGKEIKKVIELNNQKNNEKVPRVPRKRTFK